jgi:hypothetical protein
VRERIQSLRKNKPREANDSLIGVRKLFIGFKLQHSPIQGLYGKM